MVLAVDAIRVFRLAENCLPGEAPTRILCNKNDIRVAGASAFASDVVCQSPMLPRMSCSPIRQPLLFPTCAWFRRVCAATPRLTVTMAGMEAGRERLLLAVRVEPSALVPGDASAMEVAS